MAASVIDPGTAAVRITTRTVTDSVQVGIALTSGPQTQGASPRIWWPWEYATIVTSAKVASAAVQQLAESLIVLSTKLADNCYRHSVPGH